MDHLSELHDGLARAMEDKGLWPAESPWVRRVAETYPRHLFAPPRLWMWNGQDYEPVDRAFDPDTWAQLVYAGTSATAVTQVTNGLPTSSLSCEDVVADMLDSLMLEPGHATLELGTATGRNARLLAAQAGPGRVISVEYDPDLAAAAAANLEATGGGVAVRVGDGNAGAPGDGPFDRVISTYAVEEVPWAWVEQTRPGGRIVTPWGRLGHVALTVAPDGRSAQGWVQGLATFMAARGTEGASWDQIRDAHPVAAERPLDLNVALLHEDANLLFALRVICPDIRIRTARPGVVLAWLHDGRSSWATLESDGGSATSRQGGPRRLADELAAGWQEWQEADSPGWWDFGMTRTDHEQYMWAFHPLIGPRWNHRELEVRDPAA